jgi:hypothetical protein
VTRKSRASERLTSAEGLDARNPVLWLTLRDGPRMAKSLGGFLCVVIAMRCDNRGAARTTFFTAGEYERGRVLAALHSAHDSLFADGAELQFHLEQAIVATPGDPIRPF